mgnify:CR=1 FL=1
MSKIKLVAMDLDNTLFKTHRRSSKRSDQKGCLYSSSNRTYF